MFKLYCEKSSLHGFQYFNHEGKHKCVSQLFWLTVVLGFIGLSFYLFSANLEEYLNSRTITTLDSTTLPLDDVNVPSLYICNINQVGQWMIIEDNLIILFNIGFSIFPKLPGGTHTAREG